MIELSEWARDLLLSRGALVENEESGVLRALVPPEISQKLAVSDWLSLDFRARAGGDDPGEWLERLGALLPGTPTVTAARLRLRPPTGAIDAVAVLNRELVIQNGVWRVMEDYAQTAPYYLFSFQYTVESDERSIGYAGVCLNGAARSLAETPGQLMRSVHDEMEEDPGYAPAAGSMQTLYKLAARVVEAEVRERIGNLQHSANRRLARDSERMEAYYDGLLGQLEKRAARHANTAAGEKDLSRIEATKVDRAAKREDLVRKYSLRVHIEPANVLVMTLPVRVISVRLIRKKEERVMALHWNAISRTLDTLLCEACAGRARPLYLCERVHVLCQTCCGACPACGRTFCRACQAKCKCGASGAERS